MVNGMSIAPATAAQHGAGNMSGYQEMTIDLSGVSAESKEGSVRLNMIPREGGNIFSGGIFFGYANQSMMGNNFTQELRDRGLATPNDLKTFLDVNPSFGGPIRRDALWFFTNVRYFHTANFAPIFFNKNAGNPNAWTYEPDTSRGPAFNDNLYRGGNLRVTWQATPKHKLAAAYDFSWGCECPRSLTAQISPEANVRNHAILGPKDYVFVEWTAPLTHRLLLEGGLVRHREHGWRLRSNAYFTHDPGPAKLSGVVEQSTGLTYRPGVGESNNSWHYLDQVRFTASYITGAHAFKVGVNPTWPHQSQETYTIDSPMSFQFNNGVPNRLTLVSTPWTRYTEAYDHGVFVQDRWTTNRLTVTAGLRYDYFHVFFPEGNARPGPVRAEPESHAPRGGWRAVARHRAADGRGV